jgi:type I restriction enzyme S subunit
VKVNPTKADPDFVVYTLNAVIGRQQIDAISRQIIGQANINSQELRSLNIPLPPLKVQQSIMKRVESGCAKIQQIKEDSEQLEKETSSNIEKLILGTLSVEDL